MSASLTPGEFLKFCEFFYRKTGIRLQENKKDIVERRLNTRMVAVGHSSFRDYFAELRFQASGRELQSLINEMTVNETFFYRESQQLRCLVNSVLDDIMRYKVRGGVLRIWSMPCSTGEEPYSIAIWLLENWPQVDHVDVELLASDIDTSVLEKARAGLFSQRSVGQLPKQVLNRYFSKAPGNMYRISETLRDSVNFSQVNISDSAQTRPFRQVDVAFCRNMLIYFDEISRRKAAETFFDALNPGGYLFLGITESMSRISSIFKVCRYPDSVCYQKPR